MGEQIDSQLRKLAQGGAIVVVGLFLELVISFASQVIAARFLGQTGYGAVSLGLTILSVVVAFPTAGLHAGIGRFLPQYDDPMERRGIVFSAFKLSILLSLLAAAILFLGSRFIAVVAFEDPAVAPVFRVVAIAIPALTLLRLTVGTIQGLQRTVPKVLLENISLPVFRFGLVSAAVLLGLDAVGIAGAYVGAYLLVAVFCIYYLLRWTSLFGSLSHSRMYRMLLVFSVPLAVSSVISKALTSIDTILLGVLATTGDVGVYNAVFPVARVLNAIMIGFGFIFTPLASEIDAGGEDLALEPLFQTLTKWVAFANLPLCLLLMSFPAFFITTLFGSEYVAGALTLSVLAVGFMTHSVFSLSMNTLTAIGATRQIMYANAATVVVNILLNLALIPRLGFLGAAVATTASYVLMNVIFVSQLYRFRGIQPLTQSLLLPASISIGFYILLYRLFVEFFTMTLTSLAVFVSMCGGLYVFVILRFGGIGDEEVMIIWSIEERFEIDLTRVKNVANTLMDK